MTDVRTSGMVIQLSLMNVGSGRSQWPSGLRRVSTADRFLGLRVRIPSGACECCVCCQVEVYATG